MTRIFLAEPLGDRRPLEALLGAGAALPALRPATLLGHRARVDPHGLRLVLVPEPGAAAPGVTFACGGQDLARIRFAMAAMGAQPTAVDVAGPAEAHVAAAGSSAIAWSDAEARGCLRDLLSEGLVEVMGHFGRDPGEMSALLSGIGFRALARLRGQEGSAPVALRSGLASGDVERRGCRFSYARFFGVEEHRLRHRRFDGAMSEALHRSVFTSGDAVTVLPFDARRGAVLLIEQFRPGPHARRDPNPWCLEAVAGRCDGFEPPEATARREAREEAGLELGRLERIAGYYSSPGIAAEFITAFVGQADLGAAGGIHGLADEHEDIRTLVVPLEAALDAVASGEANNGPLLISLLWLDRHRGRLAADWGCAA